jgi:hypothetical protein
MAKKTLTERVDELERELEELRASPKQTHIYHHYPAPYLVQPGFIPQTPPPWAPRPFTTSQPHTSTGGQPGQTFTWNPAINASSAFH